MEIEEDKRTIDKVDFIEMIFIKYLTLDLTMAIKILKFLG